MNDNTTTMERKILQGLDDIPKKEHIYGRYGRFARWVFRTFSREYRCDFVMPEEPVVFCLPSFEYARPIYHAEVATGRTAPYDRSCVL